MVKIFSLWEIIRLVDVDGRLRYANVTVKSFRYDYIDVARTDETFVKS